MNRKIVAIGVAAVVASILAACGHDHSDSGSTTPPPSTTPPNTSVNVTTSELLANYATKPSETTSPVAVNGGAFTITDTSETTNPISVNAN
jgi:hypothetical protein